MARKISGGRYKKARKKKLSDVAGMPRKTVLGAFKKKNIRTRGGKAKPVLISADKASVLDSKTKKAKVCKINAVLEVPSNRLLRNVLMKGVVIQTELGKARITNRPSQDGFVHAVLIQ